MRIDARRWRAYIPHLGVLALVLGVVLVGRALLADDGDGSPRESSPSSTSSTLSGTDAELTGALLQLGDLPEGWREDDNAGELSELCSGQDPVAEVAPGALVQTGFSRGPNGPVLSNVIADYESDDRAGELLDAVRETIAECGEFETEAGTFQISETGSPDLGDDTVAALLSGETPLGQLEGRILYVRVDDRVAVVALAGLEGVDADVVEDATEVVAGRL